MQATVHRFDPVTGAGSLVRDDGLLLPFDGAAFAASGLRHLRTGQRLTVVCGPDGAVTALRLGGIGTGPPAVREPHPG